MAERFALEAQPRTLTGKKVSRLRTEGLVPAVIYGTHIQPVTIQIPYRALEVTLMKAGGTHLIEIAVDGGQHTVLARDVQRDVIRRDILHVDFQAVDLNQPIRATIPVHTVGESPAVEARTGVLFQTLNSIEIEALPANLIEAIEVDISNLKAVGDAVHVSDLNLGDKITVHAEPEDMLVRINPMPVIPAEEEVEEEEEETSAEPELIRRERDEDEGEEE